MANIINNNIYGGAIIPSSFVFDFVHYGPYKTLTEPSAEGEQKTLWETMAIGRHCLIKYCNYAFTTEEREIIEKGLLGTESVTEIIYYYYNDKKVVSDEYSDAYKNNFVIDNSRSYDGLIVQKTKDGPLMIGYTNHGINTGILITESKNSIDKNANDIVQLQNTLTNEETGLVKEVDDLSNTVGALSDAVGEEKTPTGLYKSISDIKSDIGSVEDETTETTVYGAINNLNQKVDNTLIPHITDFESRTRWNYEENESGPTGPILRLKLENNESLSDENVGNLIIDKANKAIKYQPIDSENNVGQEIILSKMDGPVFNEPIFEWGFEVTKPQDDGELLSLIKTNYNGQDSYLSTFDGIIPQVQVEGANGYSSPSAPVKICIGSTAPTSTVNDITIWIKTSN